MADQVRTTIEKKWFAAEKLDVIRRGVEHHNEDIGTALNLIEPNRMIINKLISSLGGRSGC